MSSPFQKKFSAKSPLRFDHGNENSRQFGGYDPNTGEVINALTGKTPSQQKAASAAYRQKIYNNPAEYEAYKAANEAWRTWDETENEWGFGGKEYPKQAELDSISQAWKNLPSIPKQPVSIDEAAKDSGVIEE